MLKSKRKQLLQVISIWRGRFRSRCMHLKHLKPLGSCMISKTRTSLTHLNHPKTSNKFREQVKELEHLEVSSFSLLTKDLS
jgi:hypothetical protein